MDLPASARPLTNLWRDATSFVGRDRDLDALAAAFATGARIVTLVGAAGIGKTRLARQYALAHLESADPGDVWFCDLAEARSSAEIAAVVARALDLPCVETSAGAVVSQIGIALASRECPLLLLDNFEHVVAHAEQTVGVWLKSAPRARALVTSREPLRLDGELRLDLPPLSAEDAVDLFLQRARAIVGGFDGDVNRVAAIVQKLDGLPLAIELAACRVGVLTLAEVEQRLTKSLELLRAARPNAPARHATLRAAIAWSWDLLDSDERAALAQASVFRGGFSLEAAEQVLVLSTGHGERRVLDVLQALREKSLVSARLFDQGMRFRLYEGVRELAAEALAASELGQAAELRHAEHFTTRGEAWAKAVDGPDAEASVAAIALDAENLAAAHERMRARSPALAARAMLVLEALALERGPADVHLAQVDAAVRAAEASGDGSLLARALRARGRGHLRRCAWAEAQRDLEQSVALARRVGDEAGTAAAVGFLTSVATHQGRVPEARALADEALALARRVGDAMEEARALNNLAVVSYHDGAHEAARAYFERALVVLRTLGHRGEEGRVLGNLAVVLSDAGRTDDARDRHEEALRIHRDLDHKSYEADETFHLGMVCRLEDRAEEARACFEGAMSLGRDIGSRRIVAQCHAALALLELEAGRTKQAEAHLERAVPELEALGYLFPLSTALATRAALDAVSDRVDDARAGFARARALLDWTDEASRRLVIDVVEGTLDLALARRASAAGEGEAAKRHVAAARARLERSAVSADRSREVRVAERWLARALDGQALADEPPTATSRMLDLGPDARWFQLDGGARVDLSRRGAPRRILLCLARARLSNPGSSLSVVDLFQAGWPDETVRPESMTNRVYVAIAGLRDLGLRRVLATGEHGYRIDPAVSVRTRV